MGGGGPRDKRYRRKRGTQTTYYLTLPTIKSNVLRRAAHDLGCDRGSVTELLGYVVDRFISRYEARTMPAQAGTVGQLHPGSECSKGCGTPTPPPDGDS